MVRNRQGSLAKRVFEENAHKRLAGRGQVRGGSSSFDAAPGDLCAPEKYWVRIRSAILGALEFYPGAREAVVRALVELRAVDEGEGR